MKNLLFVILALFIVQNSKAQNPPDLTNKTFILQEKIPNSTTELLFLSKTKVNYIITNLINGKTFIDKCPGTATYVGSKISIKCLCEDKDLYPDPIEDTFIYDSKYSILKSTQSRTIDGLYFEWKLK